MPNKRGRPLKPLSDEDVRAIRALRGKLSGAEIGRLYDRSQSSINVIQRGGTYRYVHDAPQGPAMPTKKFNLNDWAAGIRSNGVATNEINGDDTNEPQSD